MKILDLIETGHLLLGKTRETMPCFYFQEKQCHDTEDQWTMHGVHRHRAGAEQPITGISWPCGLNWFSTDHWPGTDIHKAIMSL